LKLNKTFLALHFIVFLWGLTPVLGKLITLPALQLVWWRLVIALMSLFLYAQFKRIDLKLNLLKTLPLIFWGVIVGTHWYFFYNAIKVSNVSVAMIGFSTLTLFASLVQPFLLKKKIVKVDVVYGIIILMGLCFISNAEQSNLLGILFGVLAAFTGALFGVYNGKLIQSFHAVQIAFYEFVGALIFISMVMLLGTENITELWTLPSTTNFIYLTILSVCCTTLAFTWSVEILKKIDALTVIVTNNLEPIYGILISLLLFGQSEYMSIQFYIGALFLFLAVFTYPIVKKKLNLL
jgi:drug/metabolite transporter (DMT)-like permease